MRLYNTLTRSLEELVPRDEGRVGMYVCGPTVYDVPHFGHARAAIVPDVLRRYLEWRGYTVFSVRNVTDIEDKIIARAGEEARSSAEVAETYTRAYDEQMSRLGVLPPHVAPRATGHVLEMIELIEELVAVGAAYEGGGDVLFAVRSFPRYGRLSGRDVDELRSGARVEPGEGKRDPLDFVLWKAAKPDEPSWPSPWGRGRPGWHIECSAMAAKYLGEGFDLHCGGLDLQFPHHENEIAQYESTGRAFARLWVHNGLLHIDGEKMSKSLGNFVTLADALDRYGPGVLRLFYLAAHYRSPVDLNEERLRDAAAAFDRWAAFERATRHLKRNGEVKGEASTLRERFVAAMDDDLGTPAAQAALYDLVSSGHASLAAGEHDAAAAARSVFLELAGVLGYRFGGERAGGDLVAPLVAALLDQREAARRRRDYASADRIRSLLGELGILVEDSPDGPRWHHGAPRA